jgi:hypothetical protein
MPPLVSRALLCLAWRKMRAKALRVELESKRSVK